MHPITTTCPFSFKFCKETFWRKPTIHGHKLNHGVTYNLHKKVGFFWGSTIWVRNSNYSNGGTTPIKKIKIKKLMINQSHLPLKGS